MKTLPEAVGLLKNPPLTLSIKKLKSSLLVSKSNFELDVLVTKHYITPFPGTLYFDFPNGPYELLLPVSNDDDKKKTHKSNAVIS